MLCNLGLHKGTVLGFNRAEGHQHGAPLSYPRPDVTFGDQGKEKDAGRRDLCSHGSGPRWHQMAFSEIPSGLPASLLSENLERPLCSGHCPCVTLHHDTPSHLPGGWRAPPSPCLSKEGSTCHAYIQGKEGGNTRKKEGTI